MAGLVCHTINQAIYYLQPLRAMKNLLLPAVVLFSVMLASCSRYQINMLSSTNAVKDEQTGVFNVENDSVKISYSFYGKNAPVSIKVFNKSDKPLYIDWQSSAVVIGDETFSYADKNVPINGEINGSSSTYNITNRRTSSVVIPNKVSYSSASINAVAQLPSNTTFLPPHAQSSNVPLNLTNGFINLPDSLMHKEKIVYLEQYTTRPINVKAASFTKETSPLVFKSFITLYTLNNNQPKPVLYEHEFFVSRLLNTTANPKFLQDFQVQRGDYFISSKMTNYAKVMTGVALVGAAGGAVVADAATSNTNSQQE